MITIDSNNVIYLTNNGHKPVGAIEPLYTIFTSPGFQLKINYTVNPLALPSDPRRIIETPINPWTYWTTEEKLDSIRLQRDYLLTQTDWRVIKATETQTPESQAWINYRQALRDFPNLVNVNLPIEQIIWPQPPS